MGKRRKHKNQLQARQNGNLRIAELIRLNKFNPFIHRTKETTVSRTVKYILNFFIACVQTILNVPILLLGFWSVFKDNIPNLPSWVPTITWRPSWSIAWILLVVYLVYHLYKKTEENICSESINLIWAVNYYGLVTNYAFSIEVAQQKSKDAEMLLDKQSLDKIQTFEAEYDQFKADIEKQLERVQSSMDFPEEFFDAIVRMVDLITNVIKTPDAPRYEKTALMDKLLAEVCSSSSLPGAHQASIMCPDENGDLKIVGSVNIKESVVLNRVIKQGESFVGQVLESSQGIWINDLSKPEVEKYGFDSTKRLPYKAIVGIPIKVVGKRGSERIGVVSVHFREPIEFLDTERNNIERLLEVVGHFAVFILTHENSHNVMKDVIMGIQSTGGGDRDVAVAKEQASIVR